MNKMLKVILAVMLGAVLLLAGCSSNPAPDISGLGRITGCEAGSAADIELGGPAPDFWFETAQGQATSLSELEGKIVLINFWATWCNPCKTEMPYIQQIYDEWPEEELVMLAINVGDSSDDVASFMQSNSLSFPVLLDSQGEAATRYGIPGFPTTLFIDKKGLLQNARVGAFSSKEEIESILSQLD